MNQLLALLLSVSSVSALAADAVVAKHAATEVPTYGGSMLPTLGSLVLVIAAILATGFFMRRLNPGLRPGVALLKPLSQLQIGPKEKIAVVQFQGELLVLGVTAHQISLLTKGPAGDKDFESPLPQTQSAMVASWMSKLRNAGGASVPPNGVGR